MTATRKPAHLTKGGTARELIWEIIRRQKTFTVPDIDSQLRLHGSSIREYVNALEKAGYIAKTTQPTHKFVAVWYRLIKDAPIAPRVRKDGSEVTLGLRQENMWRAMRILKHFTAVDIAATASAGGVTVTLETAKSYCRRLGKAGYLIPGRVGYSFIPSMYTGPRPPMVQRGGNIYDPNLKKVVWPKGEQNE